MEKEIKKITYLLGAGASFNALPIVSEIPDALINFIKYVKEYDKIFGLNKIESFSEAEEAINLIAKCFTIDCFIKNVFEENGSNWKDKKYIKLKNILASLLVFEQLEKNKLPCISNRYYKNKIDYRYYEFVKKITGSNNKILENINVISWNYDIQLELSIKNNFEMYRNMSFGDFLNVYQINHSVNKNIKDWKEHPHIVKLNGSATFERPNTNSFFNYNEYDDEIHEVLVDALNDHSNDNFSNIKFAWENYNYSFANISRSNASFIVEQSDIVIAIGYSFPDTNKNVDTEIFRNFKGKLFIQNTEKNRQDVTNNARKITINEIEYIDKLDQFYEIK